jgi:hypothetical protein
MKYYFLNVVTFEVNKMVLHNTKQNTIKMDDHVMNLIKMHN